MVQADIITKHCRIDRTSRNRTAMIFSNFTEINIHSVHISAFFFRVGLAEAKN
jgi:hypothetical protein